LAASSCWLTRGRQTRTHLRRSSCTGDKCARVHVSGHAQVTTNTVPWARLRVTAGIGCARWH
jgi:hypothetical protein